MPGRANYTRAMDAHTARNGRPQALLIDADDTLWENNIFFERVIAVVQYLLRDFNVDPMVFRKCLDEAEREHIPVHGYGTANFARSLLRTFRSLAPGADPSMAERVHALAIGIMNEPIQVLEGVPETLAYLSARHNLFLVTKGNHEEQRQKLDASGLASLFQKVEILREKDVSAFVALVAANGWAPGRTWMIGNSPRSDINPALAAGIKAVYIPHPHTWVLEHEEPNRHPNLIELRQFSDLRSHF